MKKVTATDPMFQSKEGIASNITQLKTLFPEAFTEGKLDFAVLQLLLGAEIDKQEEKYGLNWHGKRKSLQLAQTPSTGTLRPYPEESDSWDTTKNLMIEGDNLEVLKLLQKSFHGKVKLIYIDPPYNTGKDFIYSDNYRDNVANYLELTGQMDIEEGKLSSNTESSGRFHTAWLNMMYPRLKIARNLLREDGVLFCSCDETEHPRLRALLDEIFGHENFVADLVWAAGRKNDSRLISVSHEYIVCYSRHAGHLKETNTTWRHRKKGLDEIYAKYKRLSSKHKSDFQTITVKLKEWYVGLRDGHPAKAHKHYCHADERGVYFPADISWPGGGGPKYEVLHPRSRQPVRVPSQGWRFARPETMQDWIDDNRIHFGEDEKSVPCRKSYLHDHEYQTPYSVFYQDGRAATKRLRELMGGHYFEFPKDETVIQEIIDMVTAPDDIVVDFFAGSGTTGQAVMASNVVDQGRRRFVLVQLPEPLESHNPNQNLAAEFCVELNRPLNIAEITKERLLRAAQKIKTENSEFSIDLGFRVFKLDSSNFRTWQPDRNALEESLLKQVEHIKPDRSEDDVLYELLLKIGFDLCVPIERRTLSGKSVHSVCRGTLIVCLDKKIDATEIEPLAHGISSWLADLKRKDGTTIVFRDDAFANDAVKINLTAMLEQNGIENVRSI